jgi:hypothetical protein
MSIRLWLTRWLTQAVQETPTQVKQAVNSHGGQL